MRHHRTLVALAFLTLGLAAAGAGQQQVQPPAPVSVPSADAALKAVRDKFAPDTRLAVFDITTEQRGASVVLRGEVGEQAAKDAALAAVKAAGHTEVAMGSVVRLLKPQGSWYYAQTDTEKYLGYFETAQVKALSRDGLDAWGRAPKLMTTALFALVRERPAADAQPVCDLVAGSVLKAGPLQDGWHAVELPDGRRGFVDQASVQDLEAWLRSRRPTPENIERTALQFMGVPYLWGGTSPKGFDCSGFTKVVFRLNGIDIARDTDQQAEVGQDVPFENGLSQLRKGDLLFFCPSATRRDRISHVGIYLGDGVFIHCLGLVKRNSLSAASPIYSENLLKRLVRVKRLLTVPAAG